MVKKIDGKLSIKGTMDLIVDIDSSTIEIVDYKTGRRLDWSSGQEKTFKKLNNDKQLIKFYFLEENIPILIQVNFTPIIPFEKNQIMMLSY